ncbi:MAG: antirestriction protein ArdA [Candidatus Nomurabacteria bacterium]|nr:antirestriction protein ArdA [Candidatus Nomurabacteria bacterium]
MSVKDDTKHIDNQDNNTSEDKKRNGKTHPSIYVASLSDYNNGYLHGCWIRADQEAEKIFAAIKAILKQSPYPLEAEEYAIHDYDGFGELRLEENDNIKQIAAVACNITKNGEPFEVWAGIVGLAEASTKDAEERFYESYIGCYEYKEDYVNELLWNCGIDAELDKIVPSNLRSYFKFDTEMFIQDLEYENYTFHRSDDGTIFVFCW